MLPFLWRLGNSMGAIPSLFGKWSERIYIVCDRVERAASQNNQNRIAQNAQGVSINVYNFTTLSIISHLLLFLYQIIRRQNVDGGGVHEAINVFHGCLNANGQHKIFYNCNCGLYHSTEPLLALLNTGVIISQQAERKLRRNASQKGRGKNSWRESFFVPLLFNRLNLTLSTSTLEFVLATQVWLCKLPPLDTFPCHSGNVSMPRKKAIAQE